MAGVADSKTVDLLAQAEDGRVILVIVEVNGWDRPGMAEMLQTKVANYVSVIEDGTLETNYPSIRGRPIGIELRCAELPTGHAEHVARYTTEALEARGIRFTVVPIQSGPGAVPPGTPR